MSFQQAAILFIVLLCSISLHEFGHAWMADKRGDPLPREQGRVTLDPFKHLDPIGSFAIPGLMIFLPVLLGGGLPFALIGWGRPVQISLPNPKTRRRDDILITLAGPAVNLLLALAAAISFGLALRLGPAGASFVPPRLLGNAIEMFLIPSLMLNLVLLVFNLLPLPPLDGSSILRHATGMRDETYASLARNGWWILLILINIPYFTKAMGHVISIIGTPLLWLAYFIGGNGMHAHLG
ncbi:MAG: site-2 protease family protein [Puniceicoccales bacterium]|jgi:Zn-dependent protease|nr:site-2 protease family protein [Puniceicoccales bacterium]